VIKLYGWETSFQDIISAVRDKELGVLQKSAFFEVATGSKFFHSLVGFFTFDFQ
jgi:hypothetical protein